MTRMSTALAVAISLLSVSAHADEKAVCATASDNGQKLRDDGKLMKARQEFLVCARDVCPGTIKRDCADWLQKAETSLPTVVFSAKDSHGQDLATLKVSYDGATVANKIEGKAIFVDPGQHTFRFEIPGEKPIDQQVVIREGEKNRVVSASWQKPEEQGGQPGGTTPPPPEPEQKKSHVPAYIVGGIGIAALGVGTAFAIIGTGDYNDLKNSCGVTKTCTDDQVSPVKTKLLIADIAFGVGIVAIGTAVVLFVTESSGSNATRLGSLEPPKKKTNGFSFGRLDFAPLVGGGAATLGGTF